jgi:hypothetical protein
LYLILAALYEGSCNNLRQAASSLPRTELFTTVRLEIQVFWDIAL